MQENKLNLKDLNMTELEELMAGLGHPGYRSKQVARWVFNKGVRSFEAMTDLPPDLRSTLAGLAWTGSLEVEGRQVSHTKDTVKYLFRLPDLQLVESVYMVYTYGRSVCLSTQAGCRMGCHLCASGMEGLVRNLTAGEMYDQVLGIQREEQCRISHLVLMGTGEPLDNLTNVLKFITNITANYGLGISCRRITISTCGLVPQMRELAALRLPVTLAVSIHAPNDELRNEIMPINRKYPLGVLIPACRDYTAATGRRITFEYALLSGLNDGEGQALELAQLLQGILGHVNLIPANPVPERGVRPSSAHQVQAFRQILERQGIPVTVRRKLGADIDAACGMLRRRADRTGK